MTLCKAIYTIYNYMLCHSSSKVILFPMLISLEIDLWNCTCEIYIIICLQKTQGFALKPWDLSRWIRIIFVSQYPRFFMNDIDTNVRFALLFQIIWQNPGICSFLHTILDLVDKTMGFMNKPRVLSTKPWDLSQNSGL